MIRRLPVLQNQDAEDGAAAARPAWQWILIGVGFVLTIWVPLAIVALPVGRALGRMIMEADDPAALARFHASADGKTIALYIALTVGPVLLSFVLACLAAGALVGRFGGRAVRREAVFAGLFAAATAFAIAALGGSLGSWPLALGSLLVLAVTAGLSSAAGAAFGLRKRPRL